MGSVVAKGDSHYKGTLESRETGTSGRWITAPRFLQLAHRDPPRCPTQSRQPLSEKPRAVRTPLEVCPRLPRRIAMELPWPLPARSELLSPPAAERTPLNRAQESGMLPPAVNREPASPQGPRLKLSRFNGTSSLEAFLTQLELSAAEYALTDRRKATYLSQALEGLASEVLLNLSWDERVDCTALTTALKRRFGDCDSYLGLQDQLQHQRRAFGSPGQGRRTPGETG
ncbi:UNVERIFIED_CONTAM: hypothetical protein FKN15_023024 [Acipenser sinensis]